MFKYHSIIKLYTFQACGIKPEKNLSLSDSGLKREKLRLLWDLRKKLGF